MAICVTVREHGQAGNHAERKMYPQPQENLFEMMMRQEENFLSFCGGKGMCGKCRIQYLTPPPMPKIEERKWISPEELRQGIRLACLAYPREDCVIVPLYHQLYEKEHDAEKKGILSLYETSLQGESIMGNCSKCKDQQIIAVDLGTTTIVLQCIQVADNQILAEKRIMNPQRTWGPDVISRMEASIHGKREILHQILVEALEKSIGELQSAEKNIPIYIAGNTVMEHLLMAADMTGLSHYPFTPVTLEQTAVNIGKYQAILLPALSSFVGADITAGIYAMQMARKEHEINILLDLGTNGEMVIGNRTRMIATATAAGPAFEGRISGKQRGSDLIALVAEMLDAGVLDETGLLQEPYFTEGYEIHGAMIRQEDIRALQMAKAAIYAGLRILMEAMKVEADQITHVYLAGGFGYYLDVQKADRIGLLPKGLQKKTIPVGNTSLLGAYLYGRTQEQGKIQPPVELQEMKEAIEIVNLAEEKSFEKYYISAMNFHL